MNLTLLNKYLKQNSLLKRLRLFPLKLLYAILLQVSFSKRLGIEEGTPLSRPIVEFYYKDDA